VQLFPATGPRFQPEPGEEAKEFGGRWKSISGKRFQKMTPSQSHLVIIPSYNTGGKLVETVTEACACWQPVWVVLDGSTDGSAAALAEVGGREDGLRILALERNSGKGAAVMHALLAAAREGFTHALVLDADGQHSAGDIPRFMSVSQKNPAAMILGVPQFATDAPALRRHGRRVGNWWANLETLLGWNRGFTIWFPGLSDSGIGAHSARHARRTAF
jgi:glycosyltransferase involved in cell wall biosynthesis